MRRIFGTQRFDWNQIIQAQGLVYSPTRKPDGTLMNYWREGPYYSLTLDEVESLETAAAIIFDMLIEAGDYIVDHPEIMRKMAIPEWAWSQIIKTWNQEPAWGSVYGRYDFCFGGHDHRDAALRQPRLYEFNADTPTCLVEAAYVQWEWFVQTGQGHDQWNNMSEMLTRAWKRNLSLIEDVLGHKPAVHFTCSAGETSKEDVMNTLLLLGTCREAGYQVKSLYIENVVLGDDGRFYDEQEEHIDVIFKLYPWEFMVEEEFGRACFADMENIGKHDARGNYVGGTIWIEPPYKMLWSNKGILAVLWQLFGDDPEKSRYLIPSWFDGEQPEYLRDYVRKPLLSREGANIITILNRKVTDEVPGDYGAEGFIVQAYAPPPKFESEDGTAYPVLGVWMIDGGPAGMGIRESVDNHVTDNISFFTPHSIEDGDNHRPPGAPFTIVDAPQDRITPSLLPYATFGDPSFGRKQDA